MKADHGAQAQNATHKDVITLIELDTGGVSLVIHGVHGLTPIRSNNLRASST